MSNDYNHITTHSSQESKSNKRHLNCNDQSIIKQVEQKTLPLQLCKHQEAGIDPLLHMRQFSKKTNKLGQKSLRQKHRLGTFQKKQQHSWTELYTWQVCNKKNPAPSCASSWILYSQDPVQHKIVKSLENAVKDARYQDPIILAES